MPLTEPIADSELFRQLTKLGTLKHPTASTFDVKAWIAAVARLDAPNVRDLRLLAAAIHFGEEIASLRQRIATYLIAPYSRERGMRMVAAMANQQYLILRQKSFQVARRSARDSNASHSGMAGQTLVRSGVGQRMTADEHVTQLVDSLPHWLHHIWKIPTSVTAKKIDDPLKAGNLAIMIASIERGLRDLWHSVVWEGQELVKSGDGLAMRSTNRDLAEKWLIWHLRDQANMAWEAMTDAGVALVVGDKLRVPTPVLERTVVSIERKNGQKRRFVVGRANRLSLSQHKHLSERDMLERLYTGIFLDEPLPKSGSSRLTCREVCAAWWVLSDVGTLLMDEIGNRQLTDADGLFSVAFVVGISELTEIFVKSLKIDASRARKIIDLFVCNPAETTSLFAKSLWSRPLLPASDDSYFIVLAPLMVGSPVRRIETWLEIGGITDQRRVKGRGKPFEAHVRSRLSEALANNDLVFDYTVLGSELKRIDESEEIDLLVRIGNTVLVGEVKCFLAPVEPMDRFNYLNAIESAAAQVKRKCDWVDAHRLDTLARIGIADAERASRVKLLPIVVLNQGFGFGLNVNDALVVDLHFLSLLLGSGEYQSEVRFEHGNAVGALTHLYASQYELETELPTLLKRPPPLRRYVGTIEWTSEPFPNRSGFPFVIEFPRLKNTPIDKQTVLALEELVRSRAKGRGQPPS